MTISMYAASAPAFIQGLKGLDIVLDKAAAYAAAKKVDPSVLLQTRVYPDMFAFARQIQIATDGAKGCMARLSGQTAPVFEDTESTIEELKARVAKTIAYIESFKAADIDGSEERDIVLKFPGSTFEFKGQAFLVTWAMPNFWFHVTTAYALMRGVGVDVTKGNYLGHA